MKSRLLSRGFVSLILTQFWGAANDNVLKGVLIYMVIDGAWKGGLGPGGQGIVSICFTVPFIVLSGYAGQFADRNSKRYVSVLVKVLEIPIALLALFGFWIGDLWITLSALVALTAQSAYFGPAKYGMIPELVKPGDLSRANGTINMMTNLAVIAGTLVAGIVADFYNPRPPGGGTAGGGTAEAGILWLPGAVMVSMALAGLLSVVFLPRMEPGDRTLRYNLNPVATYVRTLREIARMPLLMVMLAWGYFYFLAGLALLIIPEYTVVLASYDVSRAEVSVLLGVMGVAIGLGSALAGLISGHAIRPRLIPIGAAGLTFFFCLLGTVPPSLPDLPPIWRVLFSSISGFVFGAGMFAGFYIIPLQALLQRLSPDGERGRYLGTANGISFAFLTLASLVYWVIRPAFGIEPDPQHPERIFLVSAILMLVGTAFFLWRMRARGLSFGKVI
ncbi:MAG: MFS transporter [Planctomycetes bacterium]|nr:MFS transporter [Planctomycetota bacterium]